MAIASGVAKKVVIKKETTWGAEGASLVARTGARYLRRKTSTLDLVKDTYQSEEIRPDYQVADMRHGVRRVAGMIDGELAPGSYPELFAAALRKDFASVTGTSGQTTISSSTGAPQFARSAGSWLTDGFRVGMVVRFTGWTTTATAQNSRNFFITALTATNMTGVFLDGTATVTKASGDSISVAATGKVCYTPTTSHTNDSFAIEHWHSDITLSEMFVGVRVGGAKVSLPPTGIASVQFDMTGKDLLVGVDGTATTARRNAIADNTAYFTTPTDVASTGVMAAVNGVLAVGGATVGLVTGMSFSISGGMSSEPAVGSNTVPDIIPGSVVVTGELTVKLQDATLRNLFVNEVEAAVSAAFSSGSGATAEFMSFTMPRCKVGGASKDDGQKGITMTMPFMALAAPSTDTSAFPTTLMIQDSLAP